MNKIKIFKGRLIDCFKNCLAEGYFPASLEQIHQLKKEELIEKDRWYDTSTISLYNKNKHAATLQELQNIEKLWEKGWRSWVAYSIDGFSYAYGNFSLNSGNGRLVGVVAEPQKKHKHLFKCECGKVRK